MISPVDLKRLCTIALVVFFGVDGGSAIARPRTGAGRGANSKEGRVTQDDPATPPPAPTSPSRPTPPSRPPAPSPTPPSDPAPSPGVVPPPAETEPSPPPAGRGRGCATDRDCKGDRVCHAGRCAYPHGAARPSAPPGPGQKTPTSKKKKRPRFSDATTVEIGTAAGFSYSRQKTNLEFESLDLKTRTKYYTFQLEFYLGYFVAPRFVLGLRCAVPYDKMKDGDGNEGTAWGFELAFSPGIAVPVGGRVALYGDVLLGLATRKTKTKIGGPSDVTTSQKTLMAQIGGEFGLKIILGTSALMRIAVRPVYYTGEGEAKSGGDKYVGGATDFRVLVLLGFSVFHVSR